MNKGARHMQKEGIAKILFMVGVAEIVLGFICGIAFGRVEVGYSETEWIWSVILMWWVGSFVSGLLLIAFAEALELLRSINYRLRNK
jgi:uncharacterized integral membrane protein